VTECVGERYDAYGAIVIPLPHPSGASGWLNSPANRALVQRAAASIRAELPLVGSGFAGG